MTGESLNNEMATEKKRLPGIYTHRDSKVPIDDSKLNIYHL